jgi:hypothetical protein
MIWLIINFYVRYVLMVNEYLRYGYNYEEMNKLYCSSNLYIHKLLSYIFKKVLICDDCIKKFLNEKYIRA